MDNNIEKLNERPAAIETVCKITQFLMTLLPFAIAVVLIYCSLYDIALNSYIKIAFGILFIALFSLYLICDVIQDKYAWRKDPNSLAKDKALRKN